MLLLTIIVEVPMILERQNFINIRKSETELRQLLGDRQFKNFEEFISYYHLCAEGANEVGTKLENLDSDFQFKYDHNPIHHMEERMKEIPSVFEKVRRKGYEMSAKGIKDNIYDIAGIRVITNYLDDVYSVEKTLLQQSDIELIKRKDYIKNPKESGYRSLHIVVSVPVFETNGVQNTPVEVQIRTVGMDMWASLEHKLRYKTKADPTLVDKYGDQLKGYAEELSKIEINMQSIFHDLS
ncbi:RelA SpoT domain-containing protein [Paucilactobacillus suebicus DSM 5007 = KCTC 3549]|uniref:RelA SpoT domain-containing protein n=2 Tax=Paucilactobacillus suebicus TaxID=152335 RepID=A0A0R1W5J6_9LACO|nr:RelA SpoT domain-containing protein [Paucilactobacillus suebicus DSM 5007 = KCTC 3549]